ncbi:MAG: helix-turn-helix domain-containing protein [Spirochaetales bacterium]|nr:helix-turn-helix domain-containing protein [Spirochaetales bacterium]
MGVTEREERDDLRFKALADHNRRAIVETVYRRPGITLQELCAEFPISRFAVMKHINILEDAGFIASEKRSIYRVFWFVPGSMKSLLESWFSQFIEEE